MGNIGPGELLVILVFALIIFGPAKLPEMGRTLGKAVREFRSATEGIQRDLADVAKSVREPVDELKKSVEEPLKEVSAPLKEMTQPLTELQKPLQDAAREFDKYTRPS